MTGPDPQPHYLIVHEDPEDGADIEHPAECPHTEEPFGDMTLVSWDCQVNYWEEACGLDSWFRHVDAHPADDTHWYGVRLEPGRYEVRAWFEEIRGFDYVEYDGGLALVDESADAAS
jgi:hypothetical protein